MLNLQKKTQKPAKKNNGLRRLLGIFLMLNASTLAYACIKKPTEGTLAVIAQFLNNYLGNFAIIVPVILFLLGFAIFYYARLSTVKKEIKAEVKTTLPKTKTTTEAKPKVKTKTFTVPEVKAEPEKVQRSVYDQEEFQEFTEGIRKKSTIRKILNYNNSGAYNNTQVKEEIHKDPVQVPEWQDPPASRQEHSRSPLR